MRQRLPRGWSEAPLGELTSPSRPRHSPQLTPHLPFVGMEHVEAHTMRLLRTVRSGEMRSSAVHFQAGDVLYGRLRPYLNKVLRPNFEGLCSAEFIVFPDSEYLDAAYLKYFLNSSEFVAFATHLNAGDRPRVDFEQIASFPVPVPPFAEQGRIVAAIEEHLSRLDAAVAGLRRVQAQLPRYRAAVLKAAVEGQFGGVQSSSWHKTTLGDILCSLGNGISKKPAEDSGQAILRISAVREMSVDTSDVRYLPASDSWQRYLLEPGDLLFTRYNGNPRFVGTCGMVREQARPIVYPDKLIRARLDRSRALPAFVQIALSTGRSRAFLQSRVRTTAGQAGISGSDLRQVPLALPSVDVQESIVNEVERQLACFDALAQMIGRGLSRAQLLRQSLLRRAFSGKLVPQNPNDEPASVLLDRIRTTRAAAPNKPGRPRQAGTR